MGNLKKTTSNKIQPAERAFSQLDQLFGRTKPYKAGQETGKGLGDLIDKIVDKIFPK